ncbi:MAG: ABC transporter substrate-binding protein [Chloroflexota bacterium]
MTRYIVSFFVLLIALMLSVAPFAAQDDDMNTFPIEIEHKFGTTIITEEPQRIVVLGYTEQDPYYALGVEPIAIRYWYGDETDAIFPWADDEAGDAEPEILNMSFGALNYEAILALEPDLISAVDAGITEDEYEQLSLIAPTLAQYDTYVDFGMPWQETTQLIGMALGKADEAEALVNDLETRIETIRDENPQFVDKTVAVAYNVGGYGYYTGQDSRGRFFTDLGFVVPDELNDIAGDSFFATVSEERLDLLDQDLLVFLALQFFEGGSEAARDTIESDTLLGQLSVVQDERVLYVSDEFDNALQFSTILSIDFLLDGLVPELAEIFPPEDDMEATEEASAECDVETRAIEDARGVVVCVPESPSRVVSLTDGDTDALVALGVDPVGVANGRGSQTPPRYLLDFLPEDYVSVGGFFQPNLEVLLELEPDLILFSYGDFAEPELLSQLNQIAPVFVPVAGNGTWQDLFANVGDAMNMQAEVDAFYTTYNTRINEISTTVDADTQFIIARWAAEGPQVMAPYIFAPAILQELGMVMPEEIPDLQEGHAHSAPLSLETLDILDADWLFVGTLQAEGDAADALEAVFDNPLFQQLTVVQNEQVVVVDGSIWTSSGGPFAANLVLDVVEANLGME